MSLPTTDQGPFQVVTGATGRTSLWPTRRPIPSGWSPTEIFGTRDQCLAAIARMDDSGTPSKPIDFSLMFFGDQETDPSGDKYRLLFEAAKFADQSGFSAVWLPERHFTKFGCLYPSASVLHAALARETRRIGLRAGSVVLPLHHPVRVAEEWAVVDNLSNGRVELAFASGWHPNDFALAPDAYEDRYDRMYQGIEQVRTLWRGETLTLKNGSGQDVDVRTYPAPLQSDLKMWLTIAGSQQTFIKAGELGLDVLTHLFSQDVDQLAENIRLYRKTRQQHGWPANTGRVSVALHTFVAPTLEEVHRHAKQPYCDYLRANLGLLKNLALSRGRQMDLDALSPEELDDMLQWAFDKFVGGRSLMGTPESCGRLADELARIGVTEVACLMDFGPDPEVILTHMSELAKVVSPRRADSSADL
ncbi:MupA/Atu3671 family FMN-dependent luciferase-like monooxygenase [Roseimaritima ulvae]|uniref:Alkanal monooxygenase alpha chain n=1 Tax=Roseimaritima ulvae TaxID=980254 RepID=A0A5B9QP10_9BACT|nr:MupA/Atu3671 family FMN-dependent luciferase-like monooxygenase [Roseimaritima ulvae]QEG40704.1 Alkanal monooxygenase alpha chain [Roseimaritima ulvae]